MKVIFGMLAALAVLGGCAVDRTPIANVEPNYSYQQAGVTLSAPNEGQVQVTASRLRDRGVSPEMLSIGGPARLRTAGVVTE